MIIFHPTDFLLVLVFVAKNCETLLTPTYNHLSITLFRNQVMDKCQNITAGLKILTKIQTFVEQIFSFLESWYSFKPITIILIMYVNYPQMYAKYFSLTSPEVRSALLPLLLNIKILKILSNRLLFLALHTGKFQSYLRCPSNLPHRFLIDDW